MNRNEPLTDQSIEAAFARRADRVGPAIAGTLGRDILAATASTRQRSVLGLRLAGILPRPSPRTAWVALALLAALLGVVLALAFTGHRQPAPFHTPLLAYVRDGDVYLANPDGSNPELVLHQDGTAFLTVAWSPDGSRLAVDGESGVVLVDPSTGASTRVGGTNPAWSADGRQLAVLDPENGSLAAIGAHLRIVEIATGTTVHTYAFPAIGDLAWSADGRWIAATGGSSGGSNSLARLDVTTGVWIELDGPSGMLDSERQPAWSPDSLHIAYIRWGSTTCQGLPLCSSDIFVADSDGSHPVRLNSVPGNADEPAWSPDGRWIAYRSVHRSRLTDGNTMSIVDTGAAIVIVHPDGTGERTIPADGVEAFAWTPGSDGFRFIAKAGQGTEAAIREVSLDGIARAVDARPGPAPNLFERTGARFAWQSVAAGSPVPVWIR